MPASWAVPTCSWDVAEPTAKVSSASIAKVWMPAVPAAEYVVAPVPPTWLTPSKVMGVPVVVAVPDPVPVKVTVVSGPSRTTRSAPLPRNHTGRLTDPVTTNVLPARVLRMTIEAIWLSNRNTEGDAESVELSQAQTSSADSVWTPERSTCHSAETGPVGSAGADCSTGAAATAAAVTWSGTTTASGVETAESTAGPDGATSTPEGDSPLWLADDGSAAGSSVGPTLSVPVDPESAGADSHTCTAGSTGSLATQSADDPASDAITSLIGSGSAEDASGSVQVSLPVTGSLDSGSLASASSDGGDSAAAGTSEGSPAAPASSVVVSISADDGCSIATLASGSGGSSSALADCPNSTRKAPAQTTPPATRTAMPAHRGSALR